MKRWLTKAVILLIRDYQLFISPLLGSVLPVSSELLSVRHRSDADAWRVEARLAGAAIACCAATRCTRADSIRCHP